MEHLHHGPKAVDLQFRYLSETNFDFTGGWLEYLDHEGVDIEKIRYRNWCKFDSGKLSRVLQNWLFFGLLRAIIPNEIPIQTDDFIQVGEDGKRFISTTHLPEYLTKWTGLVGHLSEEEKRRVARRNDPILNEACLLTWVLSELPAKGALPSYLFLPMPLESALSCALLGEALALTNGALYGVSGGRPWSTGNLFLERLEMDGWCPFIVSAISTTCLLGTIYYCATLGGPKVKLNHRRCTEELCRHTLDIHARHFVQDCPCSTLKPAIEEMVSVIRRNQIPILRYKKGDETEKLETGESNGSTPYVAISHVWSDGLGNPKGNEMNKCQLNRVQMAVNRLYQDEMGRHVDLAWWWLDTLCVPKGEAHKREEGLTISRMKEIYSKADKVLIIDSGLSACNESTDVLEILARFRLSNWIRRLWTIQEGLFARSIYLLVGETPVSLSYLISEARLLPEKGFKKQIGQDLLMGYESIFGPSPFVGIDSTATAPLNTRPTEKRVLEVLNTVASRTSTFLSDEALCIALLLDINPSPIIHEIDKEKKEKDDKNEREHDTHKGKNNDKVASALQPSKAGMIKLIELMNDVSQSLKPSGCIPPHIIASHGKRMTQPGFRWAPESFLRSEKIRPPGPFTITDPEDALSQITRTSGILCESGLRVIFPGIIITEINGDQPLHSNFLIDTSADAQRKDHMPEFWKILYSEGEYEPSWESTDDLVGIAPTVGDSDKLAVIICTYGDLNLPGHSCVLVRLKHAGADGELFVSHLCNMGGERTPVYDDQEWITEPWNRVRGRWLPVTQKWCVD